MADMPKPALPYCHHIKSRHGKRHWIFRKRGHKTCRLPGDFGSAEFMAAYTEALSGKRGAQPSQAVSGSISWLISRYRQSAAYIALAPGTRAARDRILRHLDRDHGQYAFASITRKRILAGMEARKATPHGANNWLKTLSAMFEWAVYHELVSENPCTAVKKNRQTSEGHHAWSVDEVRRFQTRHPVGTMPRLAIDLLLFTGLRRSDVIRAGRQHVTGDILSMPTQKTKHRVTITLFPQVLASIEATPGRGLAFLETARGEPFASGASFGNWFRKQVLEAGLPSHCTSHGLRKAGATIAAEAGATVVQLMAMYGWKSPAMALHYTRQAEAKGLAREAGRLIDGRMKDGS